MLSLLLCFQVQTGQSSQILLAHRFVHGGSTPDSLTVVVSSVGPPISFRLHVAQNHVLDWSGQARYL